LDNPDFAVLLTHLMPFAEQMLAKHGEFFPFGVSITPSSKVSQVGVALDSERPQSQQVIDALISDFRAKAFRGELRSIGICLDVRTVVPGQAEKSDAISARLEHANGQAIEVFKPYVRHIDGTCVYGKLFARPGKRLVFISLDK